MKGTQVETIITLSDLIDSGQFQRAEKLLETQEADSPPGLIHQAEVKIYLDRLDEAAELLDLLQPRDLPIDAAARYALTRGEWYYWRFEFEQAEEQFQIAEKVYRLIEDEFGMAKALYNRGRLARRNAEFEEAEKLLDEALKLLTDHAGEKKEYLQALIEFNLAVCKHQLGDLDTAADLYFSATMGLNKLEQGRYYASALNSYGTLLRRVGQYEESLSVLTEAVRNFEEVAAFEPLGAAKNNLALTLIRLQRFDEAERYLQESIELCQRAGDIAGVSMAFEALAELSLQSGASRKAEEYATKAIEQADLSHNEFLKTEALIALGRTAIKQNDFYAAAKHLGEAIELGEKLGSKMLQTAATLYLAECEFPRRPIIAQERLTQVREMLEDYHDVWLSQEFERISPRDKGQRLKITPENKLIIDGNFLPNWHSTKEAVETFLLKNALRQSGGNLTKAGKILGITKVYVHDKKKQFKL